jgi:tRNA G18 (ribose-2'-O)-methylase SpoU
VTVKSYLSYTTTVTYSNGPMIGKIESLNVSAAAAVLLFEIVRQRIG